MIVSNVCLTILFNSLGLLNAKEFIMYTGMSSTKAMNIVLIILLTGMSTRRGIREETVVTPKEHLTNHYR